MLRVHRDFKGLLKDVQDEYDFLAELNKSLQKKVAEWNKDEEIQRAVEMTEYCRTHSLCQMSDNEKKAERAFRDSHYKSCKNGSKYLPDYDDRYHCLHTSTVLDFTPWGNGEDTITIQTANTEYILTKQ